MDDPSFCDGNNEDEFSFRAFCFSGQTESQKVVFTVITKVCYNGSAGCKCTFGARKRRSTLNETSNTLYYIRPGPLAFLEAGEAEEQVFICFSFNWIRYHDLGYNGKQNIGLSFNYLLDLVSIFKENAK